MAVSLPSLMTVIPSGLDAPPDLGMILYLPRGLDRRPVAQMRDGKLQESLQE